MIIFYLLSRTIIGQIKTDNKWSNKTIDFQIRTGSMSGYDDDINQTIRKLGFGLLKGHSSPGDPDSFSYIEFKNNIDFSSTKFKQNTYFVGSIFYGISTFKESKFYNEIYFTDTKFKEKSDFSDVFFRKKSEFENVYFLKSVDFDNTRFNEYVSFSGSVFHEKSSFMFSVFNKSVNFSHAEFSNTLNLYGVTFTKTPDFAEAELPDTLFFQSVELKNCRENIRFDLASTDSLKSRNGKGSRCKIFVDLNSNFDKFVLDGFKFQLCFDNEIKHDEKLSIYEQVIKKCNEMGFQESAKGFNIDLQKVQLNYKYPKIGYLLISLNEYWWNIGYERGNIFRNTGIAWSISFIIFFLFMPFFGKVYFPTHLSMEANEAIRLKLNSWLRVKIALFYTSLIFFSWKMEHSEVNYRNYPWGALIVYVIFTIGIIHLAYLAGAVINN